MDVLSEAASAGGRCLMAPLCQSFLCEKSFFASQDSRIKRRHPSASMHCCWAASISAHNAATHRWGALQTYNNVLHVYGLHWAKEHALPLGGALDGSAAALRRCDLYLQHSVALEQARPEILFHKP